ncbi:mariner Mos1 transposase [Trichonephila clavipes]|nr:mariner Mos1 transposase [Trichonephila clavipes]
MNETTQQEKTTQLSSRNETTQLVSRDETTHLVSRNETTQLCIAVDRLHRLYSRIGFFYLLTCEERFQKQNRKGFFLHRIVNGDEQWIHYDNPKRRKSWGALQWDVLSHQLYSPDIAPSDYHLFRSMTHDLVQQHFTSYEEA